jgi:hypothetical protein
MSIKNIYDFKKLWGNYCSKYNVNYNSSILPKVKRIIVLGDIHGDYNIALSFLKVGKVINDNGSWIGNDTIVVQVGDQIDRCRSSITTICNNKQDNDEGNDWKILQYFTNLHNEAIQHGGAVYSLLGNHELMNVQGDFRYVSYEGLKEFDNFVDNDGKNFNNGEEARKWAFSRGNPISNYLGCTRKMALIIGSNLFTHAGILPHIAKKYNVNELNEILSLYLWNELHDIDSNNKYDDVLFNSSSPLWTREYGYINDNSIKCNTYLMELNNIYKVGNIIVGHTPNMETGISSRCNNKVWLTDYGASHAFDDFVNKNLEDSNNKLRKTTRKAQVLEILNDGEEINILLEDSELNVIKNYELIQSILSNNKLLQIFK